METKDPLVSVLMTVYNRENYISGAIESVLASTFLEFELIIVDDRSRDRSLEIARSYATRDSRVKVFQNEKNLGDYPNRNKAASYACGKYIKYVDADDLIYPYGLQMLVEMMEKYPEAGYGLCSLAQDELKIFPFMLQPREAYLYHYMGPGLFHKAPLSAIIKKDAFDKVGGFTGRRMIGDFEMWHMLSQQFPVVLMPHGFVWYRKHGDQEFSDYHKFLLDYANVSRQFLRDPASPLSPEDQNEVMTRQKKMVKKDALRALFRGQLEMAWKEYKRARFY